MDDQAPPDDRPPATAALLAPFERDVLLSTGRAVRIRPGTPSDLAGLRAFYDGLGETSTYYRFFGFRPFIPDHELQRATVHDLGDRVTLVAEADGTLVGIGEYCSVPGHADEAEVAFAVADAHHHEGIATVLLEDLAVIARAAGFRRLVAETLPGNQPMQAVFRSVGLVQRSWFDDGVVYVQLDLTADDLLQDDAASRDWRAAVRSLRPLLEPGHVVVVDAGDDPASPGRRILTHLRASFQGTVSVVHPTERFVGGVEAVTGLDELADVPDLAVVAVPPTSAIDAVDRCGAAGIPAAVVISAGFAETGEQGARRQDELLAVARRHGMRLVGPNCLGVVATPCGLDATVAGQTFEPGGIAVASQSGGVGIAIAAEARRRDAGISSFVSVGNKVDVSGNDLLRLWADDPNTNVVLLYLESFGDPVRFARIARAVAQRKPVAALKSGRTAPGRRGAATHTAAAASDDVVVDALLAHTGVMRARTLEELIDVGLFLDRQPAPRGRRIALLGNTAGPLILAADAAASELDVPELSANLQSEIARRVPSAAATANPVDLGADVTPEQLAGVVQAVGRSGEVDACVTVWVRLDDVDRGDEVVRLLAESVVDGVPMLVARIGNGNGVATSLPMFPTPERAVAALALATAWSGWRAAVADEDGEPPSVDDESLAEARQLVRRHAGPEIAGLEPATTSQLLAAVGVAVGSWGHAQPPTVELRIRALRDPAFGPLLTVGVGGDDAELRDDEVVLIAPATHSAVRHAIERLRIAPLFHGYRGRPPLPVEEVADVIHRVGILSAATPEVRQVDVSPLLVGPDGCVVTGAAIAVAAVAAPVAPPRGLRGHTGPLVDTLRLPASPPARERPGGPSEEGPPGRLERP